MLPDVMGAEAEVPQVFLFGDMFLGIFLLGGTVGGLLFGSLADRFGRRPIMVVTILMYSVFSGLTYFAQDLWHVGILRFLVAMGVGGEWAVAASLVAEVFPPKARAQASGIFHASSVFGTWLAALAGMAVGAQWRYAYLLGILPALLILWVRASVKEPEMWSKAEAKAGAGEGVRLGSFRELLLDRRWAGRAILGMLLAAVGLGTFWGVTVAGQNLATDLLKGLGVSEDIAIAKGKFAYGIVQTTGAGLGLLAFGPLSVWLGRRPTFWLVHAGAFILVPITCYLPQEYWQLLLILPVFGFFTLSMHAGYAVYFPELFPTHLRATGTSFCFNGGRILAVPMLLLSGWLKSPEVLGLKLAATALGCTFLLGILIVWLLPETKGRPLPE
jgi:MFS family permease